MKDQQEVYKCCFLQSLSDIFLNHFLSTVLKVNITRFFFLRTFVFLKDMLVHLVNGEWRIYRGGQRGDRPPDISVGNLELVGKFEGRYLTIFCLLRSQKTFITRNV